MKRYYDVFETALGWVGLLASESGIRYSTLPQSTPEECVARLGHEVDGAEEAPDRFETVREKIVRLLDGEDISFEDDAIDVEDAAPFHIAAWQACMTIPKGETRSYKWLAQQAGKPQAPRAAGQSMARNRLPLIVPCHRVVASDGSLRGFGKGASQLGLKQRLLDLEGAGGQKRMPFE